MLISRKIRVGKVIWMGRNIIGNWRESRENMLGNLRESREKLFKKVKSLIIINNCDTIGNY